MDIQSLPSTENEDHRQAADGITNNDQILVPFCGATSCLVSDEDSAETNQDNAAINDPTSANNDKCKRKDREADSTVTTHSHDCEDKNPLTLPHRVTTKISGSLADKNECSNPPINPCWTRFTSHILHHAVPNAVTYIALMATKRPRWTLCGIAALSLALLAIGYNTNFNLSVEEFEVFAPYGVRPRRHREWIQEASGFPSTPVPYVQLIHSRGDNVVSMEGIHRVFDAYEAIVVQQADVYQEFCNSECLVLSPIRFWNYSRTIFEQSVETDEKVAEILAGDTYPDGTPVDTAQILGNHKLLYKDNNTAYVTAQSYLTAFLLPNDVIEETIEFETLALEQVFPLQEAWNHDPTQPFALEVQSERSYAFEFQKGIVKDLPLVPLVFTMMAIFTCILFFRRHAVQSRVLLGLGAVVTIVCSLCSGKFYSTFAQAGTVQSLPTGSNWFIPQSHFLFRSPTGYGLMFLCGSSCTRLLIVQLARCRM